MSWRSFALAVAAGGAFVTMAGCSKAPSGAQRVDTTLPDETQPANTTASDGAVAANPAEGAAADASGPEAAAADAAPGSDTPAQQPPAPISHPVWVSKPTGEDIARYYPDRAQRIGLSGQATIACTANEAGVLTSCGVANETPSDAGFGDAARMMSRLFRMQPIDGDGAPVAGRQVTVAIVFARPRS